MAKGDPLSEARRLIDSPTLGTRSFPVRLDQPLGWSKASLLVQIDLAESLRRIAMALEELVSR